MAADSIEREIHIEAAPEIVWGVITEPEQISRWFADEARVEARAGAEGALTWRPGGRAADAGKTVDSSIPITVVEVDPFRRFCFRWNHPEGARADERNSALVEFILAEEAGGTRLRVVESGIEAVAGDAQSRARYRGGHERGWDKHLGELLDYVASESRGAVR